MPSCALDLAPCALLGLLANDGEQHRVLDFDKRRASVPGLFRVRTEDVEVFAPTLTHGVVGRLLRGCAINRFRGLRITSRQELLTEVRVGEV